MRTIARQALVSALLTLATGLPSDAQDLDSLVTVAMHHSAAPAMCVLVVRHGAFADEVAKGLRSTDTPDSVSRDDVWHIGSDGKAMTATMIARLVDRGLFTWSTPLDQLLPALAASMHSAYRHVTLRDLLSHQAGLPGTLSMSVLDSFRQDPRTLHEQRLSYARMALALPPAYAPRSGNIYSNSGVVIAATVAEVATGLSYEELMQQEVFTPLGMTTAAFGPTHRGQPLGHSQGRPQTGPDADNAPVIAPVGEIHLSMEDWGKFAIDQLKGEHGQGKLLKQRTYKVLHTPGRPGSTFALGWNTSPSLGGIKGPFLSHAGSNTLWYAVIVLIPRTESAVLVASNAGQDAKVDVAEGELVNGLLASLVQP